MFSALTTSPYGIPMSGPSVLDHTPADLMRLVHKDQGLDAQKKNTILSLLDNPETFKRFASGGIGVALARSLSSFEKMSKPAQILVSLAGFGLGRTMYDLLHVPEHFTSYNQNTDTIKIKL